jgi:hypothetical protein
VDAKRRRVTARSWSATRASRRDTRNMRGFDRTFLGSYDFLPEELLFQIGRTFWYPGASESKTPWWIDDWDHERDDAVVIGHDQRGQPDSGALRGAVRGRGCRLLARPAAKSDVP